MGKIFHQLLYTQATLHTLYIGPIQTCVYVLINDNIGVNVSLYKNSSIFWLSKSTVCIITYKLSYLSISKLLTFYGHALLHFPATVFFFINAYGINTFLC